MWVPAWRMSECCCSAVGHLYVVCAMSDALALLCGSLEACQGLLHNSPCGTPLSLLILELVSRAYVRGTTSGLVLSPNQAYHSLIYAI